MPNNTKVDISLVECKRPFSIQVDYMIDCKQQLIGKAQKQSLYYNMSLLTPMLSKSKFKNF